MDDFTKTLHIGRGPSGNVFVKVTYKGGKLSITGVEGPKANGDCHGGCGQIIMSHWGIKEYALGFDQETEEKLREIWGLWHLNDMTAGSPAQEAYLKQHPVKAVYPESHYTKACEALEAAGLQPDNSYIHNGKPYKYGSAWLSVAVPEEALTWLQALPETTTTPAWV